MTQHKPRYDDVFPIDDDSGELPSSEPFQGLDGFADDQVKAVFNPDSRRRLRLHTPISSLTVGEPLGILAGGVTALGFGSLGLALKHYGELESFGSGQEILVTVLGGLVGIGLLVILAMLRKMAQSVLRKLRRRRVPSQPWIWDHRWNRKGTHSRDLSNCLKMFLGTGGRDPCPDQL